MTECGGKRWIPRHLNQKEQKTKKRKGEMKASKPSLQLRNRQYIPHIPKRKNAAVSCFLVSLFEERRVLVGMIWFLHQSKTNKDGTFTNNASLSTTKTFLKVSSPFLLTDTSWRLTET